MYVGTNLRNSNNNNNNKKKSSNRITKIVLRHNIII